MAEAELLAVDESAPSTANLPDYLLEPNAVLLDQCRWRHGEVRFTSLPSHLVSALLDRLGMYLAPADTPVDSLQYAMLNAHRCIGARL